MEPKAKGLTPAEMPQEIIDEAKGILREAYARGKRAGWEEAMVFLRGLGVELPEDPLAGESR